MAEEKVLERIRKMLAIANDAAATEAERETALRMAYSTMAKYNIDEAEVASHSSSKQEEPRAVYDLTCWSMPWARLLARGIADLFFCKFYYADKINATQMQYKFVGTASNATTAMLMTTYIINSILKEARKHFKHNLSPQSRAFAIGASDSLISKILALKRAAREQYPKTPGTALALVDVYKANEEKNALVLKQLGIELVSVKSRQHRIDWDSVEAMEMGESYGKTIGLDIQLNENEKARLK